MDAPHDLDIDSLILIVVGAHLRAELDDRPLAYRLRERVMEWLDRNVDENSCLASAAALPALASGSNRLHPMVCTDVWYLNNHELLGRPVISVGEPGVNAATAYLSNRLPTALVIDHSLRIHLDPQFIQAQACLWGVNAATTASATEVFIERYLDGFMREALP